MLNVEKIRMMTGLSIYEKHGGAEELKIAEHYRYDYVMTQLFSSFIRYTVCFGFVLSLFLVTHSNEFFYGINTDGFIKTVKGYGILYFAGLSVYLLITLTVCCIRHNKAVRNTELYASGLRRLDKRFNRKENKS